MKIDNVDVWKVVVPTIPGTVHSKEWGKPGWDEVPKFIIRLNTDDGLQGIGETGRGVPHSAVDEGIQRVIGLDPTKVALQYLPLNAPKDSGATYVGRDWEIGNGNGLNNPAHDAFEMALLDLLGKAFNVPAHFFLGGAYRTRVRADFWIGHQSPEDAARNAKIGKQRGFGGLKMKCMRDEPWVERIAAILEAVGPDFKLTIDPNERFYRAHEAISLARELAKFPNVEIYEDPVPKWNLDWYKEIRAAIDVSVALHLSNPHDIVRAIKADACDCMNLGGGMVQFVRNAAMAEAAGMQCWHGSGNDLGIMEHSYLHAAAAARNCTLASDFVGSWTREDDLVVTGIQFENGCAIVPDKPGLGCELDETALEKYLKD